MRKTTNLNKKSCKDVILEFLDNKLIDPPVQSALVQIKVLFLLLFLQLQAVPYGLAVRIPGFHPGRPGSTPGMGISTLFSQAT